MHRLFLIINTIVLFIFLGCGSSSDEAKALQEHQLKLVGIPQEIVVNICQDKNDNGTCDVGELQAKVTVNKNDTVKQMWEKVKFDAEGRYVLANYDPTLNIIMEIQDRANLKYDAGELALKYNPDTQELSVLQAVIDADFLSEEETKELKALDNRDEIDRVLLDSLRVNQNLLKDENLSTSNALSINLEEIAKGLIELNVSKELPEQLSACQDDADCIKEIVKNTSEEVELTVEEAQELARSKKIVDGYIIELKKPIKAECENGKNYLSLLEVGEKGKIVFEKFPVGTECTVRVSSGAVIDSNNNGKVDASDKVLGFDMVGSSKDTHITPLTTLLFEKRKKGESSDAFAKMIQNFDPVTAPSRVVTNTGIEKVKIEKLLVLMEILKTSMKQFVDISALKLSAITTTKSDEIIENLDIDALISKFPKNVKTSVRERAVVIKKLIGILKDLDSEKISLNTFFVSASDGGKSIEEALNEALLVSLPKGMSLLDFVIKPVFTDDVKQEEPTDEIKAEITEEIKNDLISINSVPTANAGEDQSVTQDETVTLDASKSKDSDGEIELYEWRENGKLLGDGVSVSINDLSVGVHLITLIVKDNKGAIGSDTILVTVNQKEIPINNRNTTDENITIPVDDNNMSDRNITIPVDNENTIDENITIPIDDENTTDENITIPIDDGNTTDGNITTPTDDGNTTDGNITTPTDDGNTTDGNITIPIDDGNTTDGNITIPIDDGNTTDGNITIPIDDGNTTDGNITDPIDGNTTDGNITIVNQPPVANAGADQTVTVGDSVYFDGSASSDSDGTIIAYEWKNGSTVVSTNVTFSSNDLSVGTHTISLTVTDDKNATASDDVIITVNEAPAPPPTQPAEKTEKNVADGYLIQLASPATAYCGSNEYNSSLTIGAKGKILFDNITLPNNCHIFVPSGATIDSNNNGVLDATDKVLTFSMKGSSDGAFISPLTTLLIEKEAKGEDVTEFKAMVKDFDPVTCASGIANATGVEKTKNQKLMVLMEVLKTAMKNPADANITDINLSSVVETNGSEDINNFNIDTLTVGFDSNLRSTILDKASNIKKLINTFDSLDLTKIDINSFYINISDQGKDIEDAIRDSVKISLGATANLLEAIGKSDANLTMVLDEFIAMGGATLNSMMKPIAKAGFDVTVMEGNDVNLSGLGSFDINGHIVEYIWKEGNTTLSPIALLNKNDFSVGPHELTLTVRDDDNLTDSDTVIVDIVANPNQPITQNSDYFITTWKTDNNGTSGDNQISIPTNTDDYSYNYFVDWGDGSTDSNLNGDANHTYASAGIYTVKIGGEFPQIYFNDYNSTYAYDYNATYDYNSTYNPIFNLSSDARKLLSIEQWGSNQWASMKESFNGCINMIGNFSDTPNLSNVSNMRFMFNGAKVFNHPIGDWNVSSVTNMEGLFALASTFNQDISSWDVSNVTIMGDGWGMFEQAHAFNQDISSWNVSNVENMSWMFNGARAFNQDISSWNVSNVTTMHFMLSGTEAFNQDISSWDVSNVTNMERMFSGAHAFNQNLGDWNVSNVTNMSGMFNNVTLSTENYDALLIGWSTQSLQYGVIFDPGNSQSSSVSDSAREILENTFNWRIVNNVPSKLFFDNDVNNTNYGATLSVGSKLEDIRLTFSPSMNAIQGSSFTAMFINGGFEDIDNISLCSQSQIVGSMSEKGNIRNGLLPDARFQFNVDVNESLIVIDSNITFHEGVDCSGLSPAIMTDAIENNVVDIRIIQGMTSTGISFPNYDTNPVTIATVVSSPFTNIGSIATGLTSPNGGEVWEYDTNQTITWDVTTLYGDTVELYVLQDDPTNLADFSSTYTELLNNKNWYQFESNLSNSGAYSMNPRDLNGESNASIILIVDRNGDWDISDNTFTIINNSSSSILKKTGQTKSYDTDGNEVLDGTIKDDGFYQKGVDTNYTRDDSNETVTDHLTGLMWQDDSAVASVTKPWVTQENYDAGDYNNTTGDTATTYCNELVMGGFEDWRLPTVVELQGIVDDGKSEPSIAEDFTNTSNDFYWSSTTLLSNHNSAWIVRFGYGNTTYYYKYYNSYYVRCVRAGQ